MTYFQRVGQPGRIEHVEDHWPASIAAMEADPAWREVTVSPVVSGDVIEEAEIVREMGSRAARIAREYGQPAPVVLPTPHALLAQPGAVHICMEDDIEQDRSERADLIERALALVGEAWDDGNGSGLDGWVGPGRGAGEVDREAQHARTRMIHRAEKALDEGSPR